MTADRRLTALLPVVLLAVSLPLASSAAAARPLPQATDGPASESGPPPDPPDQGSEEEKSVADRTPDELSDAERLLRMQQVVASDEAKLDRLRADLAGRKLFLDELTGTMATFQTTWDEMQAALGELETDSEEAKSLRARITRLERRYELFNRHASLTFEAEDALRKQIVGLERKIETDRQALSIFRDRDVEERMLQEAEGARPAPPAGETPPAGVSVVPAVPGLPFPSDQTMAPAGRALPLLPETPEQIAARQELRRKQRRARFAEEALVTFVRRSEALEEQVGLERTLLEADEGALENLGDYLPYLQETLDELLAQGAAAEDVDAVRQQIGRGEAEIERVSEEVARRRVEVDALEERRVYAAGEQQRVSEVAEQRRQEADAARKWLVWLESPLHPGNLFRWAVERGPRVLAVLLLAGFVLLVLRFSLRRIARTVVTKSRKARSSAVNRADTLALSFQSLATTLIVGACVLLVLQEAGLDVKTVLGGAAILGVAIAFGAQNLMRDYFTGFMMLLEDQYELGDLVTIGSITGTVERVNMRVTMLRDLEGRVHFIPNGQIGSLTNRTYDWARALVDIPVGPSEDVDKVMEKLLEVARGLKEDPAWADEIVDEPQMLGVDRFTESGVVIKLMLKTHPERMFPLRRELLRRVKKAFDAEGIEPGFPVRVVRGATPSQTENPESDGPGADSG